MTTPSFGQRLAQHPDLVAELYYAASEIVDDFDDWGPVIQANENSVYDDSTTIEHLRAARAAIIRAIREEPPE
jgi:hypothetical protein